MSGMWNPLKQDFDRAAPTLAEFLLARIDEDERLVPGDDPDSWAGEPALEWGHDGLVVNPHRVLAECEAKRRIVKRWQIWNEPETGGVDAGRLRHDAWARATRLVLETLMRDLAAVYASHPDYRSEWAP